MLGLMIAASAAAATPAADIVRNEMESKSASILESVIVPADAETIHLSGMLASSIDAAKAGRMDLPVEEYGDTKTQTISIFNNMRGVLAARGYQMSDVIKLTVFLVGDPKLGGKMDALGMQQAYLRFFGSADNPNKVARSTVQVSALAFPGYLVEIEAVAAKVHGGASPR